MNTPPQYTECPLCHAEWRDVEVQFQACETCLYMVMPLPGDTVDIDREIETETPTKAVFTPLVGNSQGGIVL